METGKMKIAIVDDDKASVGVLRGYFERFSAETGRALPEITEFCDGVDFVENYRSIYDIVFLDIDMPIMDGFKAAERLREMDPDVFVVFFTALASYAADGYSFDACDFMLKPVLYARFSSSMKRIMRKLDARCADASIAVRTNYGMKYVPLSKLVWVETVGHKLYFHAEETLTSWGSLKEVVARLTDPRFVRINNGCIVNLDYVTGLHGNELDVGGTLLMISRGCKRDVVSRLAGI